MSDYLPTAGGFIAAPPFRHQGAVLHGMLLPASRSAQQAVLDATLNRRPGLRFEALGPFVLLTALYVDAVTSTDDDWQGRGITSEVDIGIWTLVQGGRAGDRGLRWHPQYLFVDSATAMAIGREIYGFPKHLAEVIRTTTNPKDPRVEVRLPAIEVFGPGARPKPCYPIRIKRPAAAGPAVTKQATEVQDRESLAAALSEAIFENALDAPKVEPPFLGALPAVFLKQIRDIADPRRAAYQAVTTLDLVADSVRSVGLLPGGIEVQFPKIDSLKIGELMGLAERVRPFGPAFWLKFDFTAGFGSEYG